jgi:hypothetical protein
MARPAGHNLDDGSALAAQTPGVVVGSQIADVNADAEFVAWRRIYAKGYR